MEELKLKAKKTRLWNAFLTKSSHHTFHQRFGPGLSNLEYAPLCEIMGRSSWLAPELFNCSPPDTGNMEVLAMYGSPAQQDKWLVPLLNGDIRSAYLMTEPKVASSDATNIECRIERDGDEYVINGEKWWSSGAMDPRCKLYIVMGRSNEGGPAHTRQSMILVPAESVGVTVVRHLSVYGYDDAPHGHAQIKLTNVRVPVSNMILGEGRGFEIAQGRLGPGRIHHCMRMIGCAERAVDIMLRRTQARRAFGSNLADKGTIIHDIAQNRIEIQQVRLLVLQAASMMDTIGNKDARQFIAMIKVSVPDVACRVIDRAIQSCGGQGVSQDTVLARMWSVCRTLRLADGPDEVHRTTIAKMELKKSKL